MRAPQIVRDFLEWRWAPCVALTVGSLTYVGLAVLLIPTQIDGGSRPSDLATAFDRSAALPGTAFAASLAPNSVAAPPTAHEPVRHTSSQNAANDPMGAPRRGFSPPIEQPETPPQPPPPPPPPPPPAPTPQAAMPTPQPVLNQPPPAAPQDQAPTPPPAPPPPANGDEAAPPTPPATP
jgi:hypothetical protein